MSDERLLERWDVICRVVDHYGDAGVCLRLARALAATPGRRVRLLADRPDVVLTLVQPRPQSHAAGGWTDRSGVHIAGWDMLPAVSAESPADVVVETFGGGLPPALLATMHAAKAAGRPVPLWINLEYLSAEHWVEGCHGLPSPQAGGLTRWYVFPGFSARTGGLSGPSAASPAPLPADLAALIAAAPGSLSGSLFCYRGSPLPGLLDAMQTGPRKVRLLVPQGMPGELGERTLGETPGSVWRDGNLTLLRIPFVDQAIYDTLLSTCDFNLVRGEDSFVRAQWAGRPLLWAAYRQQADAHLAKVEAWLQRCAMPPAWAALHRWFNGGNADAADPPALWSAALAEFDAARSWANDWRLHLQELPRLERTLLEFALRHASPLQ